MTILTIDLGTSATKVALWSGDDVVALARAPLETTHSAPGRAEQDAHSWWSSVVTACADVRRTAPDALATVEAIGFAAARETFVLVDEAFDPLMPGVLWSDRRAEDQVAALGDPDAFRARTGVVPTAGAHAAKLAWLVDHDAELFGAARWILAPRDLVVARLTGVAVTDETLASRTGLCELGGWWLPEAVQRYRERLPEIRPSTHIVGKVLPAAAGDLGLPPGVQVVLGAGDRACEVLGVGAAPTMPMVSWGTTANVSVPHAGPADALPLTAQVSRGALGGFVVEAGLSAAGAAIGWLASVTGRSHDELLALAAPVPPGADGVLALPWFAGARAPWWRSDAHAALLGITEAHGPAELCRAIVEGVAFDVARCMELIAPEATELALAGAGAGGDLWRQVLGAVCNRVVARRALDDAASVGARLIVGAALGEPIDVDQVNAVVARDAPDAALARAYGPVREAADASASAVLNSR